MLDGRCFPTTRWLSATALHFSFSLILWKFLENYRLSYSCSYKFSYIILKKKVWILFINAIFNKSSQWFGLYMTQLCMLYMSQKYLLHYMTKKSVLDMVEQ